MSLINNMSLFKEERKPTLPNLEVRSKKIKQTLNTKRFKTLSYIK